MRHEGEPLPLRLEQVAQGIIEGRHTLIYSVELEERDAVHRRVRELKGVHTVNEEGTSDGNQGR